MSAKSTTAKAKGGETRRDFMVLTAGAMGTMGVASMAWPFIDALNPSADTLALATVEVDLSPIEKGQAITVMWQGKPVFIRHRTAQEIEAARAVSVEAERAPRHCVVALEHGAALVALPTRDWGRRFREPVVRFGRSRGVLSGRLRVEASFSTGV